MSIILCFCCACAELAVIAENVPRPASARKMPARTMNRPNKTRGLKKADREGDFFFMELLMMWMEFSVKRRLLAESPLGYQPFFQVVCGCPKGLLNADKFRQAFFEFFPDGFCWEFNHLGSQNSGRMEHRNALSMRSESDNPVTIPCPQYGVEIKSSGCLLSGDSRLKSREARAIPFREQL